MNQDNEISVTEKLEILHARTYVLEKMMVYIFHQECLSHENPETKAEELKESLIRWIRSELSHTYVGHLRLPAASSLSAPEKIAKKKILEYTHELINVLVVALRNPQA